MIVTGVVPSVVPEVVIVFSPDFGSSLQST